MNAQAPLIINPLGNGFGNVHPDVIFVPQNFAGFRFWMVFTPYPLMDDRLENPTIRASHDGVNWQRVGRVPDPLIPPPSKRELHHADPELVYDKGYLHLVYLTIHRRTDEVTFNLTSCKEDLRWSNPTVIHKDVGAVSPTFQVGENIVREWFIRMSPNHFRHSELLRREGPDLTCLGPERKCDINIPGYVPWHIDILNVENGYEALVAAFPRGSDEARTILFHLSSRDGFNFQLGRHNPLLEPSSRGWDNRNIYRSTFLREKDGTYRIWYSAASWGRHFGIGFLEGPLDSLTEPKEPPRLAPVPSYFKRLPGEVQGRLRYEIRRRIPANLMAFQRYLEPLQNLGLIARRKKQNLWKTSNEFPVKSLDARLDYQPRIESKDDK